MSYDEIVIRNIENHIEKIGLKNKLSLNASGCQRQHLAIFYTVVWFLESIHYLKSLRCSAFPLRNF